MIIGTVSYDPEKVLYAEVKLDRAKWVLAITQSVSDSTAIDLEIEYDEHEEAIEALCDVDVSVSEAREKKRKESKVGFDAVGTIIDSIDESDAESERIGFDVK